MSGKVIGINLPLGYRGNISRTPDTIVQAHTNRGDDPIQYGEPVVYDKELGGVRKMKSGDVGSASIIGIAVRHIGQPYANAPDGYYYAPGDVVDVLVRGSIMVELADADKLAIQGKVYACDGSNEAHQAGDIVCDAGGNGDTMEIPGAIFATGNADANKIAEVTILTRSI